MGSKKPRRPRTLKSGEAEYLAEVSKPGVSKVDAARKARLHRVPGGHVERVRREIIACQLKAAEITIERIVEELGVVAFARPRRLLDNDGNLKHNSEWGADGDALSGFDVERKTDADGETYYVLKIRFWNKNQALETLLKWRAEGQGREDSGDKLGELLEAIK